MTGQRRTQETRVSKGGFVYKAPGEKLIKHVISIALTARVTPGRSGSCVVGNLSAGVRATEWHHHAMNETFWVSHFYPRDSFRSDLQV